MPRPKWEKYREIIGEFLNSKNFIDGSSFSPRKLPSASNTREELEKRFKICSDREFRLVVVEDFDDYKVLIQIPDGKSECDFYVWYAKFGDEEVLEFKVPSHDDLAKWYLKLKELSEELDEYLVNAVIRLIRDRMSVEEIIERYFTNLSHDAKLEVSKFLSTLKWIALQEDTNYPPPRRMGSKYTLAVYALLEAGFNMSEIRRVIKF